MFSLVQGKKQGRCFFAAYPGNANAISGKFRAMFGDATILRQEERGKRMHYLREYFAWTKPSGEERRRDVSLVQGKKQGKHFFAAYPGPRTQSQGNFTRCRV
jgi:hypothetical protein